MENDWISNCQLITERQSYSLIVLQETTHYVKKVGIQRNPAVQSEPTGFFKKTMS